MSRHEVKERFDSLCGVSVFHITRKIVNQCGWVAGLENNPAFVEWLRRVNGKGVKKGEAGDGV